MLINILFTNNIYNFLKEIVFKTILSELNISCFGSSMHIFGSEINACLFCKRFDIKRAPLFIHDVATNRSSSTGAIIMLKTSRAMSAEF